MYKSEADQIKNELQAIIQTIRVAKDSLKYAHYLHIPKTEEERCFIAGSSHLRNFRKYLWRLTVRELSGIIENSGKYGRNNIFAFIAKIKSEAIATHFEISEVVLKEWESTLKSNETLFQNFISIENKLISSYDHFNSQILIEHQQAELVLSSVEGLINNISFYILKKSAALNVLGFNSAPFDLVELLSKTKAKSIATLIKAKKDLVILAKKEEGKKP